MKKRVLLVEDDLHVRAFMDEALHFLGFEVAVTPDAETALARFDEAAFDLVLTDHRMPGMEGLDLVRVLREERRFAGRIYVVSGVLSASERQAYAALRVDGIAAKPLSLVELNCLLRERETARGGRR